MYSNCLTGRKKPRLTVIELPVANCVLATVTVTIHCIHKLLIAWFFAWTLLFVMLVFERRMEFEIVQGQFVKRFVENELAKIFKNEYSVKFYS